MSSISIKPSYPIFTDIDGQPLEYGYVWIGAANLDPQTNPIQVYLDAALTIPAAQPIRTLDGYLSMNGSPANIYVAQEYSIRVMNKNGTTVYSSPNGLTDRLSSAQISYLPAGTGAVATTVQAKLRQTVSVKDFGAVGDGLADDTVAMQNAHNTGKVVYYPAGTYRFISQINISSGGIIGDGPSLTNLNCVDTSSNQAIKYIGKYTQLSGGLTSGTPTFQDFTLNGGLLKSSGAGIQFNAPTGDTSYADFRNVNITYFPICIDFINASLWKIIGCTFLGHTVAGVKIDNTDDNDAGDSHIIGCMFVTSSTTSDQILQLASGGLKIIGNKLLGSGYGYRLAYTGTKNTSNLIISGNSIENFSLQAITLTKVSAGLTIFPNVVISGNQISVSLATPTAFLIASDSGSWLQNVSITGNVMQLPGVTNSYGISLTGVTCLSISGNTFRGNGGTSQAIGMTSCVDAKIGTNIYSNITTPYTIVTPVANNSVVFDSQSGSATTSSSGWSAYYGSLYQSPATTVTFSQPFQVTPSSTDVVFSCASGDGSISAIVVSISKTQLQFVVIASRTPGFAATVNWKVFGVL